MNRNRPRGAAWRPSPSFVIAGVLAALTLSACAGGIGGTGGTPPASSPLATAAPVIASGRPQATPPRAPASPDASEPVTGEVPDDVLAAVRAQLEALIGADAAAAAVVVDAEAVTWPDGSLGCPEPGMSYTEALVPGYRIVFEAGGKQYDYRLGQAGPARQCTTGRPLGPGATP